MKQGFFLLLALIFCQSISAQLVFEEDINLEPGSSDPRHMNTYNGKLYFEAEDPMLGRELHVYDLATGESDRELDLKEGFESGGAEYVLGHSDYLYFVGRFPTNRKEFLRYDLSTKEVEAIRTADFTRAENAVLLTLFDEKIFMQLDDDDIGQELGIYDIANDELVFHDLNSEFSGFPSSFEIGGGKLWFSARDTFDVSQLWAYDENSDQYNRIDYELLGTDDHPRNIRNIKYIDGEIYFMGNSPGRDNELWIYNTVNNELIQGPEPSPGSPRSYPDGFIKLFDKIYFTATEFSGVGRELFSLDIGDKTLNLVADINPNGDSGPYGYFVVNDKLYFGASDNGVTRYMYAYDPMVDQLSQLASIDNNGEFNYLNPTNINDEIVVVTAVSKDYGQELFRFDTEQNDIELIADVHQGNSSSSPYNFTAVDGKLYMSATEFATGDQVWRYDPTSGNATLMTDPGQSTNPRGFAELGNKLYFGGYHPDITYGLLYLDLDDGTLNPTGYVTPQNLNHIKEVTAFNGKIYFTANDPEYANEMFVYDPVADEGSLVVDINNDPDVGTSPEDYLVHNNDLYFTVRFPNGGREFYKLDGDTDEVIAMPVVDQADGDGVAIEDIHVFENEIYFSARNDDAEIYKYEAGTNELIQVTTIEAISIGDFTFYNDKIFMSCRVASGVGIELYSFDPQTDELSLEADLAVAGTSSEPRDLIVFNDLLYFTARLEAYGRELWKFEEDNAQIVTDIRPGAGDSDIFDLLLFNNKLYFSADDGFHGRELWSIAECLNVTIDTEAQVDNTPGSVDLNVQGGTLPYTYLWDTGQTTEDLTNVESGNYACTVTDAIGCISVVEVEVGFMTPVTTLNIEELRIFPNPADQFVNVSWNTLAGGRESKIEIINTQGIVKYAKDLLSDSRQTLSINTTEWVAGIYFISIQVEDAVIIRRIILQ